MRSDEHRELRKNKSDNVTIFALLLFLCTACTDNPYNNLNYYYCNFGLIDIDPSQKDYSYLLDLPSAVRSEKIFRITDISCDTTAEITDAGFREKLAGNILLNGYYYFKSTSRLLDDRKDRLQRQPDLHKYLAGCNESDYRYFFAGELMMIPGIRSFLISENYKNRFCELWLVNTDLSGRLISGSVLSKYQEVNGSLFSTERISTVIRSGRILVINYENSAFPSDAANKDLRSYRNRARLKIKLDDNGDFSVRGK